MNAVLAIVGTAGRGSDAARLTLAHWRMMNCVAQSTAAILGVTRLVSGGSAWSDHVAVQLYLDGHVRTLTLHLPAHFFTHNSYAAAPRFDPDVPEGARLNDLHGQFQRKTGINPFDQIAQAIVKSASTRSPVKGCPPRLHPTTDSKSSRDCATTTETA